MRAAYRLPACFSKTGYLLAVFSLICYYSKEKRYAAAIEKERKA